MKKNQDRWNELKCTIERPKLLIALFSTVAESLEAARELVEAHGDDIEYIYTESAPRQAPPLLAVSLMMVGPSRGISRVRKYLVSRNCQVHLHSGPDAAGALFGAVNHMQKDVWGIKEEHDHRIFWEHRRG